MQFAILMSLWGDLSPTKNAKWFTCTIGWQQSWHTATWITPISLFRAIANSLVIGMMAAARASVHSIYGPFPSNKPHTTTAAAGS